jgi:hypothetical protein
MKLKYLLALVPLGLAACATGYHEAGFTGGFSDIRLAPNVARVSFNGNGFTSTSRVEMFLLLREAEVTLQSGYRYFAITGSRDDSSSMAITTSGSYSGSVYGNSWSGTWTPPSTINIYKPGIASVITMANNPSQLLPYKAWDASYLSSSLRAQLDIKGM